MTQPVLNFSERFQEAIIGHMLLDYPFFLRCKRFLQPEWFSNPIVGTIAKQAFTLHTDLDVPRLPKPAEIQEVFVRAYPDKTTQNAYFHSLKNCYDASQHFGLSYIAQLLTSWIRLMKFRGSLMETESIYNRGDYEHARIWLQGKLQEINETTFHMDTAADFSSPDKLLEHRSLQFDNCLTLGEPTFDTLLLRNAKIADSATQNANELHTLTNGCLAPGDSTIILGASNAGKTSAVITTIGANLQYGLNGKQVLYVTLEQKEHDIQWRLVQTISGLNDEQLLTAKQHPTNYAKFKAACDLLNERLKYFSHTKPHEMFVENVIDLIRTTQEERIARHGRGYDLLVVDYPGKLRSKQYTTRRTSAWEEQQYIYDMFVNFARHYNIHTILPAQVNREGFKVNNGDGQRLLDQGDIAGSYGIMQLADNVLTINRSQQDVATNMIKFHAVKCRSNGHRYATFVSRTDLSKCRTHGLSLAGTFYPPGAPMSQQLLNDFLMRSGSTDSSQLPPSSGNGQKPALPSDQSTPCQSGLQSNAFDDSLLP